MLLETLAPPSGLEYFFHSNNWQRLLMSFLGYVSFSFALSHVALVLAGRWSFVISHHKSSQASLCPAEHDAVESE